MRHAKYRRSGRTWIALGTALLLAGGFAVAGAAVSLARIRLPLPEGLKRINSSRSSQALSCWLT